MDACSTFDLWITSINLVLNGISIYMICLLYVDQRRIERRYEAILPPGH